MSLDALHPRGLFGCINGAEVQFLTHSSMVVDGERVYYVNALRSEVPEFTEEVLPKAIFHSHSTAPREIISIPVVAVADLNRWDWFVVVDGIRQQVLNVLDSQFVLQTYDRGVADLSDEWEGNYYEGWCRFVDAEGLDVTVEHSPFPH